MNGICNKTTQLKKKVKMSLPSIRINDSYDIQTDTSPHIISPEFKATSQNSKCISHFALWIERNFSQITFSNYCLCIANKCHHKLHKLFNAVLRFCFLSFHFLCLRVLMLRSAAPAGHGSATSSFNHPINRPRWSFDSRCGRERKYRCAHCNAILCRCRRTWWNEQEI